MCRADYRRAGELGVGDPLALFCDRLGDYRAQVSRVAPEAVGAAVAEMLGRAGSRHVVVPADLPSAWAPREAGLELERDRATLKAAELEGFDAAISGCALAIAETGTIVLDSGAHQGRRASRSCPTTSWSSSLPNRSSPVCPTRSRGSTPAPPDVDLWPSATSDIELNRVEGVHGPRRLDVLIVTAAAGQ